MLKKTLIFCLLIIISAVYPVNKKKYNYLLQYKKKPDSFLPGFLKTICNVLLFSLFLKHACARFLCLLPCRMKALL